MRETARLQLGTPQEEETRSRGFDSESDRPSSTPPTTDFPWAQDPSPLRREILEFPAQALHSQTSREAFPDFRDSQAQYSPQQYSQHEGGGGDYSNIQNTRPRLEHQQVSNVTSQTSGSAFDSFSPRSASPVDHQGFPQLPGDGREEYEFQPRNLDNDYGGFGEPTQISRQENQAYDSRPRDLDEEYQPGDLDQVLRPSDLDEQFGGFSDAPRHRYPPPQSISSDDPYDGSDPYSRRYSRPLRPTRFQAQFHQQIILRHQPLNLLMRHLNEDIPEEKR